MIRLILCLMLLASPVWAVEPNEMMNDPVLEQRARDISAGLRCPVCQNESIDESNATLSRDLRLLVRERLLEGDSNGEVVDYVTQRYGEFVLLKPRTTGSTLILWATAPVLLLLALLVGWRSIGRQSRAPDPLSDDEQRRIYELIGK
jgi:cytochrome c-type biogenesis protein CcmH